MPTIGVVGTGIFANQKHLPAIAKTEGLEIVACVNRTASKAQAFADAASKEGQNVKVYSSVEELIADPRVETIDALLPVDQNLSIVQAALKAKKPVCFEKPLSATLEDGIEIVKLAESTSIPVMVLENWCFHHGTLKLKELLPRIGSVVMFNFQASGPFRKSAYHGTKWRQAPKHAGGFLSDAGVHDLAQITDVLGPVGSVSARATQCQPDSGTVDTMSALFNMADGKTFGSYTQARYSAASDFVLRFQIFGSEGSLVYEKPSPAGGKITLFEGRDSASAKSTEFDLPEDELNGVVDEFAHWRDVLNANDSKRILSTPRKAFQHYAAIHAAVASAEKGGQFVHVKQID